jgi:hypothetical protein
VSGLELAALIAAAVWLGVLTFLVVLLVRQLSLITAWAQEQGPGSGSGSAEGIEIGAEVPESALDVLPPLRAGLSYVVFLAGNCQPCRELALEASRSPDFAALRDEVPVAAVVRGSGAPSDEIERLLPSWVQVVRGDEAELLTRSFEVAQTPSVMEVERGNVTGRAVAGYGLINFLNLVAARAQSDAADYAGPPVEVAVTQTGKSGG